MDKAKQELRKFLKEHVEVVRVGGLRWTEIENNQVRFVFGRRCPCVGVPDELIATPTSLAHGGPPICHECGEDYAYDKTEVRV